MSLLVETGRETFVIDTEDTCPDTGRTYYEGAPSGAGEGTPDDRRRWWADQFATLCSEARRVRQIDDEHIEPRSVPY